jgi:hypothetical protein
MKFVVEHFNDGQASYARGVGLRTVAEKFSTMMDGGQDDEACSLLVGYLDGVVASIRRTDNLLLMPKGPDG